MYVLVPAVSDGTAPDTAYLPIVKEEQHLSRLPVQVMS